MHVQLSTVTNLSGEWSEVTEDKLTQCMHAMCVLGQHYFSHPAKVFSLLQTLNTVPDFQGCTSCADVHQHQYVMPISKSAWLEAEWGLAG